MTANAMTEGGESGRGVCTYKHVSVARPFERRSSVSRGPIERAGPSTSGAHPHGPEARVGKVGPRATPESCTRASARRPTVGVRVSPGGLFLLLLRHGSFLRHGVVAGGPRVTDPGARGHLRRWQLRRRSSSRAVRRRSLLSKLLLRPAARAMKCRRRESSNSPAEPTTLSFHTFPASWAPPPLSHSLLFRFASLLHLFGCAYYAREEESGLSAADARRRLAVVMRRRRTARARPLSPSRRACALRGRPPPRASIPLLLLLLRSAEPCGTFRAEASSRPRSANRGPIHSRPSNEHPVPGRRD